MAAPMEGRAAELLPPARSEALLAPTARGVKILTASGVERYVVNLLNKYSVFNLVINEIFDE